MLHLLGFEPVTPNHTLPTEPQLAGPVLTESATSVSSRMEWNLSAVAHLRGMQWLPAG